MPHVAVVGAGIAGLSAARALRVARPDVDVTVIDGASRVGGKLRTGEIAGLPVDEGAESFLFGPAEAVALVEDVGLGADLVHPATSSASVWARGGLRPLPRTLLGVPAGLRGLPPVLGISGTLRVAGDLLLPRTAVEDDVTVGAHLRARIGSAAVDRLVDPLLGGVYAGHADHLSLRATMPTLDLRRRSVVRTVRRLLPRPGGRPVFATVDGGLGRLADATAAASGAHFVLHRPVRALSRTATGWRLVHGSTRDEQTVDADAVVLALPAAPAARLLDAEVPAAAADLAAVDYASVGIVSLGWRRADFPTVRGSGYLVPAVERRPVKAVTFASAKWPHLDTADVVAVRCSFGRAGEVHDLQRDDADLVADSVAELARSVGIHAPPIATRVTRWGGALPQYAVGHLDLVARVRAAVAAVPGLAVCGAAYDGVGIPACIRSADAAVRQVLAGLPPADASATMGA